MLRQHINFSHLISISVTLDIDAFLFLFEQARPKVSKVENIVIHVILSELFFFTYMSELIVKF